MQHGGCEARLISLISEHLLLKVLAQVFEKNQLQSSNQTFINVRILAPLQLFYVKTVNSINQLPTLNTSANQNNCDIVWEQGHRYYHREIE